MRSAPPRLESASPTLELSRIIEDAIKPPVTLFADRAGVFMRAPPDPRDRD